jgi:hypothetical protein
MIEADEPDESKQTSLAEIVGNLPAVKAAKKVNTLSRIHERLIAQPEESDKDRLAYQHTVFCQTSLPYRNPGDDVREWEREQGAISLSVEAGRAKHPKTGEWVKLGLPWGTKPRLILAHLNGEALRQDSPEIEVDASLSAFVKRIRGFDGGREIRMFKDQLSRLSVATVRMATTHEGRGLQINGQVVTGFALWPELDERQRVLWPSTIQLSLDYFYSLKQHAVPLNEVDLAALAHSALALDVYAWLAQRLHRIAPSRPVFIQWPTLKEQFGPDYEHMRSFKRSFLTALRQVKARYLLARVEVEEGGLRLSHSHPPVAKRVGIIPFKPSS